VSSTDHEVPHYVVSSTPLLVEVSATKIYEQVIVKCMRDLQFVFDLRNMWKLDRFFLTKSLLCAYSPTFLLIRSPIHPQNCTHNKRMLQKYKLLSWNFHWIVDFGCYHM